MTLWKMSEIYTVDPSFFNSGYLLDYNYSIDNIAVPCSHPASNQPVRLVLCIFYFLICILAIVGNSIVALVIGYNRRSMSSTDTYLFHLTIADILFAATLPFWAISMVKEWLFGDFMCKLVSLIQEANFYCSILFLACISIDRFLSIFHAAKIHTHKKLVYNQLACALIWLLGILFSVPALFKSAFRLPPYMKMVCYEMYGNQSPERWKVATSILRHTFGFLIPLAIMLSCYGFTIKRLLQTKSFRKQKAMKVIIVIVLAFLISWLPYNIAVFTDTLMRFKIISETCELREQLGTALYATQSLALLHSCINPILYALIGVKFRNNFLRLIKRKGVTHGRTSSYSLEFAISSVAL
uniref:Chemokine (C-X-C motif) receptor 1 n=1 Tax=Latimeria chalumnae TaxID=7897 RepID=H3A8W5_LATCH|nr:PREDICTED: C-X-C chemokine receptor type 2-like [Latimeria chalumnae]|eukprot:XP_006008393.2 PREDICTED: C-X-C chemokine receptor type 2-like [Latimeria chalumnae]